MTTSFSTGTMAHSDDATFRAWGSAFAAILAAIGLVQTADTGQINWTTVLRPTTNTAAGYEVWRFDDDLQATAPIFLKIEYGTGSSTTAPSIWLTVGVGSDGAGTITNPTKTTRVQASATGTPSASTLERHACHTDGAAWIVFHANSSTLSTLGFFIGRTCDTTGAPTAEGCVVYTRPTSTGAVPVQALRFASPATVFAVSTASFAVCFPHGVTSSLDGTTKQLPNHWMPCPTWRPVFGLIGCLTSEFTRGTSFPHIPFGLTERTWMPLGDISGLGNAPAAGNGVALIWA